MFNTLKHQFTCPRCGELSLVENEIKGGNEQLIEYRISDVYERQPRKAVQNGGRPRGGTTTLEGYAYCERCDKDFLPRYLSSMTG
ncbi:hypothetical protein PLCT2_00807 [Planctomycetaceae bacterium]|nr:hypothetical protein PLCT2_00807 [Planctomycetaceae bacterium]